MPAIYEEPCPDIVAPAPADDPLGERVLAADGPGLAVFEPRDLRVVIGRGQDPRREVLVEACRSAGVPIHRRLTGGGTVVLAPGMVVAAVRLAGGMRAPDELFALVNGALVPAVAEACGARVACRGHGDLALRGADGIERKVLGASLRQSTARSAYLGVFLVEDAVPLMESCLAHPSREPGYRGGRGHRAFCTHLGSVGCTVPALIAALRPRLAAIVDAAPGAAAACPA
jgi:lipoate-protein ligase A